MGRRGRDGGGMELGMDRNGWERFLNMSNGLRL
jgi:hypothetical protein